MSLSTNKIKIFKDVTSYPASDERGIKERYKTTTKEFRELYGKAGVYLLWYGTNSQKPIYIGRAISNLGKTISRHFMKWDAKELKFQVRNPKQLMQYYVTYEEFPTCEVLSEGQDEIIDRETEFIEQYQPRMNLRKGADKHKDPTRYIQSLESRELLRQSIENFELEQEALKDEMETAAAIDEAEKEAAKLEADLLEKEAEQVQNSEALRQALQDKTEAESKAQEERAEKEIKDAKEEIKETKKVVKKLKRKFSFLSIHSKK